MSGQTTETEIRREDVKEYLQQYHFARKKKRILEERHRVLSAELNAPAPGSAFRTMPTSRRAGTDGPISVVFRVSEVEDRIEEQRQEMGKAVLRIMDLIDLLPPNSMERTVVEMRHIDCKKWERIAQEVHMSRSRIIDGQALSMAEVERVMNTEFSMPSGEKVMVELALMDSGDQTDAVYEFCLINYDWVRACKGVPNLQGHYRISTVDKAGSRANGMQLVLVDGGKYKDMIAARMRKPNGTGAWMVHRDCDQDYAEQVTAEHKVTERAKGKVVQHWALKTTHADNHYLDCEVYAAAAADVLEVRSLFLRDQPDEKAQEIKKRTAPPEPQPTPAATPEEDWIQGNDTWV